MGINSKNFEQIECKDTEDFLNNISPNGNYFKGSKFPKSFIFRGQSDASWDLEPSALRLNIQYPLNLLGLICPNNRDNKKNLLQIAFEAKMINSFFDLSDFTGLTIPGDSQNLRDILYLWNPHYNPEFIEMVKSNLCNWPPKELWSLLAIAQHHGIPTRLLDWTWSSFVAAYFASADINLDKTDESKALAVWAFYIGPNKHFEIENDIIYLIESPYANNPNLRAQKGVHMIHFDNNLSIESLNSKPNSLALHDAVKKYSSGQHSTSTFSQLIKFTLPATEAPDLLLQLLKYHISTAILFPGYSGVVNELYENDPWKKPIDPISSENNNALLKI